jgi:hypothetical protein
MVCRWTPGGFSSPKMMSLDVGHRCAEWCEPGPLLGGSSVDIKVSTDNKVPGIAGADVVEQFLA